VEGTAPAIRMLFVALLVLTGDAAAFTYTQRRAHAQCSSNDLRLGDFKSLGQCAEACALSASCRFFIYQALSGDCYQEYTLQASCLEGWDYSDTAFTFYELEDLQSMGCTEPRAPNFNSRATLDNGSCEAADPCVSRQVDGRCSTCTHLRHGCDVGNHGYRNPTHDTVYAQYLGPHLKRSAERKGHGNAKVIDGDLEDWRGHDPSLVYRDVAFAKADGEEVVFEPSGGGQWFGESDFSAGWMAAWNDAWLYLALDVSDDKVLVGTVEEQQSSGGSDGCWSFKSGLQLGFEVGGPSATVPQLVQAVRSDNLEISRLVNLGLGLRPGQQSCVSSHGASVNRLGMVDNKTTCCVNGQEAGRLTRTQVAILRNPNNQRTAIEIAIAMRDLMPEAALTKPTALSGAPHPSDCAGCRQSGMWNEGLRIGFSFALNDGDESVASEGWLGFYPRAIKTGSTAGVVDPPGSTPGSWHGGMREPSKCGVLELAGQYYVPRPLPASSSAHFNGWIFLLVGLPLAAVGSCLLRGTGARLYHGASSVAQAALGTAAVLSIALLGWFAHSGGGMGSFAWGVVAGVMLDLGGRIAWRARALRLAGAPLTLTALLTPATTADVGPLASADHSASSFAPPVVPPLVASPTGGTA